ncbi:MAG: hypothetical protein VXX55_13285, partial [Planctomycetota bacterium]|nr:hypothetical protein [Planctomycetota bacterium]
MESRLVWESWWGWKSNGEAGDSGLLHTQNPRRKFTSAEHSIVDGDRGLSQSILSPMSGSRCFTKAP